MSSKIVDLRKNPKGPGSPVSPRCQNEEPFILAQPFPSGQGVSHETMGKWLVRSSRLLCRQGIPIETVLESHASQVMNSSAAGEIGLDDIAEFVEAGYVNQRAMESDFDECIDGLVSEDKSDPILIERTEDPFCKSLEGWRMLSSQVDETKWGLSEYSVIRFPIKPWSEMSYRECMPFFLGTEDLADDLEFYSNSVAEENAAILEEIGESPLNNDCRTDALIALVIKEPQGSDGAGYIEGWFKVSEAFEDAITGTLLFALVAGAETENLTERHKVKLPEGLALSKPGRELLYLKPNLSTAPEK
jgi:hypothetical protein